MKYLLPLITIFLFISCSDNVDLEPPIDVDQIILENDQAIQAFLADNNITNAMSSPSGLYYVIDGVGTGDSPRSDSEVMVSYSGYTLDGGDVFDETAAGEVRTFPLPALIAGWQEGLPKFKVGDTGTLYIPAQLGFGTDAPSNLRPIIFDITLVGTN